MRGKAGYLTVDYFPYKPNITTVIINAWKDMGYDEIDYNSHKQIGVSRTQYTNIHGVRQSTNGAFLRPIRGRRSNLTIETGAYVIKVIVDEVSKRAVGVEYKSKNKSIKKVFVRKEVIISAGSYNSPKLLMLSGIGPAKELKEAKIKIIKKLPVGHNLHDHAGFVHTRFALPKNLSTLKSGREVLNDAVYWLNTHEGQMSAITAQTVVFSQTKFENRSGVPDIQYVHDGFIYENFMTNAKDARQLKYFPGSYYDGVNIVVILLNPKSRGSVKLNKTDPIHSPPLIQQNYLTHSEDMNRIIEGAQKIRDIFKTPTFKQHGLKELRTPVAKCNQFEFGGAEYDKCLASIFIETFHHPVGTCKMGCQKDSNTVVDFRLKVHGIRRLRVVDASIMPLITKGNINAAVIMIAEKASDMIKKDWLNK